jgi:hypothetical protein
MKEREGDEKSRTPGAEIVEARKIGAGERKRFPVKDINGVDRSALNCESLFNDDRSTDARFYQRYIALARATFLSIVYSIIFWIKFIKISFRPLVKTVVTSRWPMGL